MRNYEFVNYYLKTFLFSFSISFLSVLTTSLGWLAVWVHRLPWLLLTVWVHRLSWLLLTHLPLRHVLARRHSRWHGLWRAVSIHWLLLGWDSWLLWHSWLSWLLWHAPSWLGRLSHRLTISWHLHSTWRSTSRRLASSSSSA